MAQPNLTPKVAVVAAVAVAAVAHPADLAATIQMSHLCGVKQLFLSFFGFLLSLSFFKSNFPHVRALPEQVQQQQQQPKKISFFPLNFFQGVFCLDNGASALAVSLPIMCIFFK